MNQFKEARIQQKIEKIKELEHEKVEQEKKDEEERQKQKAIQDAASKASVRYQPKVEEEQEEVSCFHLNSSVNAF